MTDQQRAAYKAWRKQYRRAIRPWRFLTWFFGILTAVEGLVLVGMIFFHDSSPVQFYLRVRPVLIRMIQQQVPGWRPPTPGFLLYLEVAAGIGFLIFLYSLVKWKRHKRRFRTRRMECR